MSHVEKYSHSLYRGTENTEVAIKMGNPEKVGKTGTQDEEKQNKNITQYALDTAICKQTQITTSNWR